MKQTKFKVLEKVATADIAFEAYGRNLNELFENSALAVTSVMADIKTLSARVKHTLALKNQDIERLLFDFLNELVFLKDADGMLFKTFDVSVIEKNKAFTLNAVLSGEPLNPEKHDLKIDVKAITMHMFKIEKKKGRYIATVVPDI